MLQRMQICARANLRWPLRCLCLLVSIIFVYWLTESATRASAEPREPIAPIPLAPALDPQRVALGERLFYDVRLSHDHTRACTTCHPLERGGMDGRPRAFTANGTLHLRNTPTIFNVGLNASFNWDGIANTLEAHMVWD